MKKILSFVLISFLLPAICILLEQKIQNNLINLILYGIQAASPSIAALVVYAACGEVKSFGEIYFHRREFILSFLLPLVIVLFTMVAAKVLFCVVSGNDFLVGKVSSKKLFLITWTFFAEELGWRGFLEPQLKKIGLKKVLCPLITGIIWCCWHYHYFIQTGFSVPLWLFAIAILFDCYIYSFLMELCNQNLLSAMAYHFFWNLGLSVFLINPENNGGSILPYLFVALFEGIFCFVLFWKNEMVKFHGR